MKTASTFLLLGGMLCLASSAPATTLSDADGFASQMATPTITSVTVQHTDQPGLPDGTYCFSIVAEDGFGTTAGSTQQCRTITGSMSDRQIALSWAKVPAALRYRIYSGKNGLAPGRYHATTANSFTYRSDAGSSSGSVPDSSTAYLSRISPQGSWFPRLLSRQLGGGLEIYGDAGRSPGLHIGGEEGGTYREAVLGFALHGGHWAAHAAPGDVVLRVQDGSIHFSNQSPAYPSRMTIGKDGVFYMTPANLPAHPPLGAGQYAVGWNVSGGRGETDFYQNRGAGWQGGYAFYAQSGNATWILARVKGNGGLDVYGQVREVSDAREKTNIQRISNALGTIRELRGVRFNWKDARTRDEKPHLGLIAQEVMKVLPEVVAPEDEKSAGDERYALHYSGLIPILIEAVKEQQQQIDTLEKRLAEMETRLDKAKTTPK